MDDCKENVRAAAAYFVLHTDALFELGIPGIYLADVLGNLFCIGDSGTSGNLLHNLIFWCKPGTFPK